MDITDEAILKISMIDFKKIVKWKIRISLFETLENIKQGHSKKMDILHFGIVYPQPYLTTQKFTSNQASKLFYFWNNCVNEFKSNFHSVRPLGQAES